ncbi:protein of unknown function [Pseudomonas sp. JV551A1]|uniref:Uncharacterized protein n=1 Tax=Pseudomonas inefficax TaxID=2078786 RepID=A0AAQ1SRS8_9PSED|nr:protein of unknown function [Pseudomonas sp. JV551A1]SPO59110.1 protein of unknown function [Pseudomonas inefficax]
MCRDGPQSGPGDASGEADNLGPLRAPSRHKAAPTGTLPVLPVYACFASGLRRSYAALGDPR